MPLGGFNQFVGIDLLFKIIKNGMQCCTQRDMSAHIEININLGTTAVISPSSSNQCLSSELATCEDSIKVLVTFFVIQIRLHSKVAFRK